MGILKNCFHCKLGGEKMGNVKITIIGGGSYTWGPTLIRDIVTTEELKGSKVVLHDIDHESLTLIYNLGKKIIEENHLEFEIEKTTELEEALKGADFVILTISTGGLEAMRYDLEIPEKYGIYQSVGDTVGPGGLSRALRNIPVIVGIAKEMERICPNAWLLNYTNPMTTLCRAVTRTTSIKTIGLCHELFGTLDMLKQIFKVQDESEIEVKAGGINHLVWILDVKVRGEDGFPKLYKFAKEYLDSKDIILNQLETQDPTVDNKIVKFELLMKFGALPAAGDRHIAEFFPYFLTAENNKGEKYGVKLTTIEHRLAWRSKAKSDVEKMVNGRVLLDMKPSREAASKIISAIVDSKYHIDIMNLPNIGQIANLPKNTVVETFGVIGSIGAYGIAIGHLPDGILNIINRHVINQEMIVEAALTGDRNLALQALLNDPLVRNLEDASKMLDEMLRANKKHLPQFFK